MVETALKCDRYGTVLWTQRTEVSKRYLVYAVEKYYACARLNEAGSGMTEVSVCLPCFLLDPENPEG